MYIYIPYSLGFIGSQTYDDKRVNQEDDTSPSHKVSNVLVLYVKNHPSPTLALWHASVWTTLIVIIEPFYMTINGQAWSSFVRATHSCPNTNPEGLDP